MKKLFVPYEIAKNLKALDFDEPCLCLYRIEGYDPAVAQIKFFAIDQHWGSSLSGLSTKYNDCFAENESPAPMYQQVQDWLREKHNFNITIRTAQLNSWLITLQYFGTNPQQHEWVELGIYYEALDKAIEKALTLIK